MTALKHVIRELASKNKLQIKQVIYDCNCSRSHFYKVLNGEREASEELLCNLAKVFNMSLSDFQVMLSQHDPKSNLDDVVVSSNEPTLVKEKPTQSPQAKRLSVLFLGLAFIAMLSVLLFKTGQSLDENPEEPKAKFGTLFIQDVTIPDGTPIPINTSYTKIWRVKNTGSIPWVNKVLKRTTPHDPYLCSSPDSVDIPTTEVGQIIDIHVEFTTPNIPTVCRTDWKMADKDGNYIFPGKRALFSIVNVVYDKASSNSGM